jgi:ketosteroid isomerase-like protein
MSEQNVDLHRRILEAYSARDIEAGIALSDPQIEVQTVFTAVGGGVYQGHDGLRTFQREFQDVWGDEFLIEPEAFFDLGDRTLAFTVVRARGKQSGAEVTTSTAQVLRWRNGLCVHFKAYAHREDALTDLGVSEDALEPIAP